MNGSMLPQASLFLGIIPALILLYISLKGYEGKYKDKTIFLSFVVGIIAGFIAAVIELVTLAVGLLSIILFPLLEQLLKTMILNLRRMQGKPETVIYGLSLGVGFGSIFTPVSLILSNMQTGDLVLLLLVVLGSFGIIMFQGATGVIIGYGVYRKEPFKYVIFAILVHIPVTLWFFVTAHYNLEQIQIGLVFYGVLIYWYATRKLMPQILIQKRQRRS